MILTETRRKPSVWLVALWTWLMVGITPIMYAQSHDAFAKWASPRIIPIQTLELRSDGNDLVPLRKLIGNSRVVALGEPTHGAHEPLEFRNRLIKFLVERSGFTAVALETGFTEAYFIDAYIQGGPGDCRTVTSNNMSWGFGHFEENQELVQWLRNYNLNRAHPHKIHFVGMDLTGGDNGEFPNARRSIDDAIKTLERVDSATANRISARFAPHLTRFSRGIRL